MPFSLWIVSFLDAKSLPLTVNCDGNNRQFYHTANNYKPKMVMLAETIQDADMYGKILQKAHQIQPNAWVNVSETRGDYKILKWCIAQNDQHTDMGIFVEYQGAQGVYRAVLAKVFDLAKITAGHLQRFVDAINTATIKKYFSKPAQNQNQLRTEQLLSPLAKDILENYTKLFPNAVGTSIFQMTEAQGTKIESVYVIEEAPGQQNVVAKVFKQERNTIYESEKEYLEESKQHIKTINTKSPQNFHVVEYKGSFVAEGKGVILLEQASGHLVYDLVLQYQDLNNEFILKHFGKLAEGLALFHSDPNSKILTEDTKKFIYGGICHPDLSHLGNTLYDQDTGKLTFIDYGSGLETGYTGGNFSSYLIALAKVIDRNIFHPQRNLNSNNIQKLTKENADKLKLIITTVAKAYITEFLKNNKHLDKNDTLKILKENTKSAQSHLYNFGVDFPRQCRHEIECDIIEEART